MKIYKRFWYVLGVACILCLGCMLFLLGVNRYIIQYAHPYIVNCDGIKDEETCDTELAVLDSHITSFTGVDVVIVLGSKVYADGRLSQVVQDRADSAITLRKNNLAKKILVSGDNRTRWYDEVTTIKKYLFEQGVPASAIFLDYAGLDTYDSMYRAQYIFGVTSMIVPTQQFHLPRSIYLARELGIQAFGMPVDTYLPNQIQKLYIREFFARGKAWYNIVMGSLPHHLGEKISLDGPSNSQ